MSRENYVRRQKDAMGHAIDAHARGDSKTFHDATNEIVRCGKAIGSRADVSENARPFESRKPAGPSRPKRKHRGRTVIAV